MNPLTWAWWTQLSAAYGLVALIAFRPTFRMLVVDESISDWGEFTGWLFGALILSAIWVLWIPIYVICKGFTLLLGNDAAGAAAKLAGGLEKDMNYSSTLRAHAPKKELTK